ncbi:phosphofructokinase [Bacillus sp. LL01]|uniref:1-phosphofructokinase n=1 Tax=Bacillus sp. LL01 TaxID=1665556 RepID=UPI00064D5582|nr:1-phosphofructokinase [Bacillus sp. LL01]KMJ56054.1 phosphofructokinase [Bacillus sp. LL01]
MIYTVTLNPAVDYFLEIDELTLGQVNRSVGERKAPGGKGINVSRVLKRLGYSSEALGFIGGFTGRFIEDALRDEAIQTNFIKVNGDSRINVKVHSEEETELNGTSPEISKEQLQQLESQLKKLTEGDVLVLAGSVPTTLSVCLYQDMISIARKQGAFVCLDTSGESLDKAIQARPSFIKPNHHELGEMYGVDIKEVQQAIPYAKDLVGKGIEYVLVSFAGEGALLATKEEMYFATPPRGIVQNSVGAGDSTVAGFIAAMQEGKTDREALSFSVASGSATAFSKSFCERKEVEEFSQTIDVKKWEEVNVDENL